MKNLLSLKTFQIKDEKNTEKGKLVQLISNR